MPERFRDPHFPPKGGAMIGNGHEYRLFGLPIRSALPLPELAPDPHGAADAVEIRLGTVAPPQPRDGSIHWLSSNPDGAVLSVTDIGRFAIRGGREIVIDAEPAASERNLRLYLLGSAMGALLHQRRLLPLHANAIEVAGKAVAFLGHSGAGKSTLAAAFHDAGHAILSDDVCVVTRDANGFVAQPGIPRLRLWRDAVERSGRETGDYERAFDALDKYTVPTAIAARSAAMPLGAVFLLARAPDTAPVAIRRLGGTTAMRALMENTYRGGFIPITGDTRAHFEACVALSNAVPVYELSRPWTSARQDETLAEIRSFLLGGA